MAPSAGAIIYKAFHRVCPPPCPGEHVRSLITSPTYGRLNDRAHIHTYNTPRSLGLLRLVCSRPRPLFFFSLPAGEEAGRGECVGWRIPWIEGRESPLREDRRCQRPREGMLTRRTPPCLSSHERNTPGRSRRLRPSPAASPIPRKKGSAERANNDN